MPFHGSDNASEFLGFEFNDQSGFDFDSHFLPELSGQNDLAPAGDTFNDFIVGEAPALAPEKSGQTSFPGDVLLSTEAPFGSDKMTAITLQNKLPDKHYTPQLSRACSPHGSSVDWEDYLNFSPDTYSSAGALSETFGFPHQSPRPSHIPPGGTFPPPEPFIRDDSIQATSGLEKMCEGMNLEAVTKPLMLVDDIFFTGFSNISDYQSSGISEDIIEWVASEFRNLLAASHEASASFTRKLSLKSKMNEARWTPLSYNNFPRVMEMQEAASSLRKNTQELRSLKILSKAFHIQTTHMGILSIELLAYPSQGSSRITTAAFTFTPAYAICKKGVEVQLLRTSDTVGSPTIARNIISFNVIPRDAPIFEAVICNDIGTVQELFSSRQASPHDRLPNGDTLLVVSQTLLQSYLCLLVIVWMSFFRDDATSATGRSNNQGLSSVGLHS